MEESLSARLASIIADVCVAEGQALQSLRALLLEDQSESRRGVHKAVVAMLDSVLRRRKRNAVAIDSSKDASALLQGLSELIDAVLSADKAALCVLRRELQQATERGVGKGVIQAFIAVVDSTLLRVVRVMQYGLGQPLTQEDLINSQIKDAHHFRNKHVEIERTRRQKQRDALEAYKDIQLLEKEVGDAVDAIQVLLLQSEQGRIARGDKRDPPELTEAIKAAKAHKKSLLDKLRLRRKELRQDAAVQRQIDRANEEASAARKAVRNEFSQHGQRMRHGTYTLIEAAAEQSRKSLPLYDKNGLDPNDPMYRRWRGEGRLGAQISDGMDLTSNTFVQINAGVFNNEGKRSGSAEQCAQCERPDLKHCPPRGERQNGCLRNCPILPGSQGAAEYRELCLRIGTDPQNRAPIWGKWPMRMHRPLPEGSKVAFVATSRRKEGPFERQTTELTMRCPGPGRALGSHGAVAIDIGWRRVGRELRVATWLGEDGEQGELRLSPREVSVFLKADELRSTRDKELNQIFRRFFEWFDEQQRTMPEWMRLLVRKRPDLPIPSHAQAVAWMEEWKQDRFAKLVLMWASNRMEGDAELFGACEAWRDHDLHLWRWETGQRGKAIRRRRDKYRCFAAMLGRRYGTLILEDFDLRTFARRPAKESQETVNEVARGNRQIAALSALRQALINVYGASGRWAPARKSTRMCNVCSVVEKFDAAKERVHTCVNGHTWDQDVNAGINLLRTWHDSPAECRPIGEKRKESEEQKEDSKESRRDRSMRLSAERRERLRD